MKSFTSAIQKAFLVVVAGASMCYAIETWHEHHILAEYKEHGKKIEELNAQYKAERAKKNPDSKRIGELRSLMTAEFNRINNSRKVVLGNL